MSEMPAQRPPDGDGKKAELLWTRLQNEQLTADKTSRIRHGRRDWNPRKTQQGMARRYQGVVPDGRTLCKHLGTVENRMEKIRGMRGRHQRALSPWIDVYVL